MEQKTSILIADPNEEFRRSCRERLCAFGYSVIAEARDGEDALSKIGTIHPTLPSSMHGCPDLTVQS